MGRLTTKHPSKVEWLSVADLHPHAGAQRPLDERWAKSIASKFDPDKLGFPLVAAIPGRGGKESLFIVDGQHRVAAVRIALGEEQLIQCEVKRGASVADLADEFLGRNSTKAVRVIHKFLIGVTAGLPMETAITKLLAQHGLRPGENSDRGTISAVASLMAIYRLDQGATLARTMGMVMKAWGPRADSFNGDLLRGLGLMLFRYNGALEDDSLTKKLASHSGGPSGVLGKGRGLRDATGGPLWRGIIQALVHLYNLGKRNKLPSWDQAGKSKKPTKDAEAGA